MLPDVSCRIKNILTLYIYFSRLSQTAHRKTLLEVADTTQKEATPLEPPATVVRPPVPTQNFSSFEEGVDYLGMLSDRPPVAAGASGHSFYTVQPMQLLSWYPRAYIFPKFMDLEKCNHVKGLAEKKLAPSGLALKRGDSLESTKEIRTSQGTFLARGDDEDGVLAWIEDKIAVLTGIPAGHGEPFNVLRYENTQHYDSHYDVFMTEEYGKQKSNRVRAQEKEKKETEFFFFSFFFYSLEQNSFFLRICLCCVVLCCR